MSGITVQLRFFASIREQLGCSEEMVTLPTEIKTVGRVRDWLIARGGVWAQTLAYDRNLFMSCELELCDAAMAINEGNEIAFFPPVTGG